MKVDSKQAQSEKLDDNWWDYYSDQPYILKKEDKPSASVESLKDSLATLSSSIINAPSLAYKYINLKNTKSSHSFSEFCGLGVQPYHKGNQACVELIEELGVKHLLLRVPSWTPKKFESLRKFIDLFPNHDVVINILQCREMVLNPELWRQRVHDIFHIFSDKVNVFQIANASNRSKWGCHFVGEYLTLQEIAESVKNEHFPTLTLLGSSIIDFEPLASIRSLINNSNIQMDGCAAALYVNRRLSPFNKQFAIFDFEKKIHLAYAILQKSNTATEQAKKGLWITETNWPLLNTKPYTPNSGNPRSTVDEATQAQFLTEYYQIAHNTGMVEKVYWWQLINPGYGLVDHRGGQLRKMPSFYALKDLISTK